MMYWNNREQSRATFLGEWTRSGDKYIEDEDGYFVYCGRRDDMLKVGGMYVSPFEVEGGAAQPSGRARSRRGRLAGRRRADQAEGVRGAQIAGQGRRGDVARLQDHAAKSSRPTNIRAGSSSAPSCRRPRPARFSASSCARRRPRTEPAFRAARVGRPGRRRKTADFPGAAPVGASGSRLAFTLSGYY